MRRLHPILPTALVLLAIAAGPASLTAQADVVRAEIFGTALNRLTGEPVAGATVVLSQEDAPGTPWTGKSDASGRFRTPPLPLGRYDLAVTSDGYAALEGSLGLDEPGTVDVRVQIVPVDFALEPVIAVATRRTRLEQVGFYERLRFGDGHYITREELDHHAPTHLSDVLRGIPGVRVLPGIARPNQVLLRGNCVPRVVLDGLLLSGPVEVDSLLPTIDIAGVEVYHGAAAPILYTGETTCGVVMLWSRTPDAGEGQPHTWKRTIIILGFTVFTMLGFAP
ncbi:MAG: carboxypeptidase regulatory-like domain-containing protein [Gammaproteobacteria bacterium]|nr:carboxypeptidase regulatory-like domain-containing protein [Gammaproteobacteria bacterium]MDE0247178.1 carboxypeptidase regulatory-like domain-containing protein [Gammaproteobacteria bacterium]